MYVNLYSCHIYKLYIYSAVKSLLTLPFFSSYLSHLKYANHQKIYILHKDNPSKYKMQFLNNYLIIKGKKAVQTCLALREKVIAP